MREGGGSGMVTNPELLARFRWDMDGAADRGGGESSSADAH